MNEHLFFSVINKLVQYKIVCYIVFGRHILTSKMGEHNYLHVDFFLLLKL